MLPPKGTIKNLGHASRGRRPKSAGAINALEAVFLASIIPNPKRYYYQFTRGEVSDRWRRHLRWIMRVMVDRGKISEEEFLRAEPYSPIFRTRSPSAEQEEAPSIDAPPMANP